VTYTEDSIAVKEKASRLQVKEPAELNWASVGAEIVVESTGLFTKGSEAESICACPVRR